MTGKRGFTLIELLVVLAVVGTLLALAAPHYLGSVDKAKEVVLRENLSTMRATLDKFYADTGKRSPDFEVVKHVPEAVVTSKQEFETTLLR